MNRTIIPEQLKMISKENESMIEHTSFKIGGSADLFIEPTSDEQLIDAVKTLNELDIPYYILGNGSNIIVRDGGIRGAVIMIGPELASMEIKLSENNAVVNAQAGILLSVMAKAVAKQGLTGMEPLSGIPGSLGGAVFMNAGAYGSEIKDIIKDVVVYDPKNDKVKSVKAEDMALSYRHSLFQENGEIILSASFVLRKGKKDQIQQEMREFNLRRNTKQPMTFPSAGSFFKRPKGHYAGGLIEEAGLKGLKKGGAQISDLHAGFMINVGGATSDDIEDLMQVVRATVYERTGVMLEPEVRIIGERESSCK